ncbi:MAG: TrgA family protein [Microgenomates group bacterium]|jgi:hypothetical protein
MPTAAKLVGAAVFALVAFIAAYLFIPALPEGTQVKLFAPISAAIGLVAGWKVMGNLAGKGYQQAISFGLQTSIVILFFALLGFSTYLMIVRSTKGRYEGPSEAVLAVFQLMLDYAMLLASPATPIALAVGGVLGGLIVEWSKKRWS